MTELQGALHFIPNESNGVHLLLLMCLFQHKKEVNIEFPVLLDQNGDFAKRSNVIVFPSTFVIDKNGEIKYGVNAAIEWGDPELMRILKSLL